MPFFTADVPCPSCGYNLRGLSLGHGCPECGVKIVSNELTPGERAETKRIEAEVEENLRSMEEEKARRDQIAAFLAAWEHRGQRFDLILDRVEKILDRYDGAASE
jgi:hypothetical protein